MPGVLSNPYNFMAPPTIVVSGQQIDFNLATFLGENNYWDNVSAFAGTIIISATSNVSASTTSNPAFNVGTFPAGATLTIINETDIIGEGGNAGLIGGTGFLTTFALTLDNKGRIAGGGGGGGNGGSASNPKANVEGFGPEGEPETSCNSFSGRSGGAGGKGGNIDNEAGVAGVSGGSSSLSGCTATGGTGGDGGALGVAGDIGTSGTVSGDCCGGSGGGGGAGGAAGNSVDGFSLITFLSTGTLTGPTVN